MRPYLPNLSVLISDRPSMEALLLAGTFGLSPEHLNYAGKWDKIKDVYPSESGSNSYSLQNAPGLWAHVVLALSGRCITVKEALPKEARPRRIFQKEERFTRRQWNIGPETFKDSLESLVSDPDYQNKIYIGNLPFDMSDTALLKMFVKFGEVKAVSIVLDKMSGRSKGFGFIQMSNESEVQSAIQALHDKEILGNGELVSDYDSSEENIPSRQVSVMSIIETASKELARLVCYEPGKLQDLEWRDLERMLALVFDGIGYAVRLTRSAKDGGKDIIVEFVATRQKHSYYVEVKHWVSGQKVGNTVVREFLSVVVRDQKQGGIIISTSGFSGSAMEGITEIERKKLRLGNSDTVVSLCRTYLNVSCGLVKPVNYTDMLMSVTRDTI